MPGATGGLSASAVAWVGDAVTAGLGYTDSLIGNALAWVTSVSGLLEGAANSTVINAVAYIGAVGTAFTGWSQALTTGIGTFADRIITDNTEGGDNNTGTLAYQQGTEGAPPVDDQNTGSGGSGASYEDNSEWWERASGWHPGTWWGIRDLINWGAGYDPEAAAYNRTPIIRTGNVEGAGLPISGKFTLGSRGTYWGTAYNDAGQQASMLVTTMVGETSGQTAVNVAMAAAGLPAGNTPYDVAVSRGMRVLSGPTAPDEMVGVLRKLGRPMSRDQLREVVQRVKKQMNIGPAEDALFDLSGGLWDSRTGEFIGKIWEF